ncbi:unnamed protein product (macronuclear) [Paramecium tetraurelia]|uniref:NAC-A/B domain-containing protein n=1 Tax=Paramecium tetraurelia TaxID=5888 RepID=A0CPH0_PARTE|nr:uncharacterized protein GSPATT00009079001 [Paramecium tetraurelia]CAK72687.1 unnamed protein product [Paramecium tetraurelia]|eukprot:XP_001440084.1 hypothetical protein (macronuclear) [Paramecium tetraurelia strain d4-2]
MAQEKEIEIKEEKEQTQEHHHDHDHDHDHNHDHSDSDDGHNQKGGDDKDKKANRGEKKFRKAMLKLGMKPVAGINRVTIKRGKQFLLYIDNPEVLKSANVENSYIVIGEAKVHDPTGQIGKKEAENLAQQVPKQEENKEPKPAESTEQASDEGIPAESIKMVMEHCKCDRSKAVEALRKSDNDTVQAILALTG